MFRKLGEAVVILTERPFLFSAIILTVWLPGNVLVDYLGHYVLHSEDLFKQIRVTMWIETIFGPIYIGAMVYALARLKEGRDVSYLEAIAVGFKNWGRLFAARFVAGLLIVLGLVALIVPGIVLLVRYALLDCVVVLEGAPTTTARARSTLLTAGRRWQIFWAAVVFICAFIALSFLVYFPQSLAEQLNVMAYDVVADCFSDLAFAVIQITMFLFYWEARTDQPNPVLAEAK